MNKPQIIKKTVSTCNIKYNTHDDTTKDHVLPPKTQPKTQPKPEIKSQQKETQNKISKHNHNIITIPETRYKVLLRILRVSLNSNNIMYKKSR